MLEKSYGLNFFLKSPKKKSTTSRYIYLRVTVDGIPKETSTKRNWDARRWDQDAGRAIGTKEDARTLNFFLEALITKISQFKTDLINAGKTITTDEILDFVKGKTVSKSKVLEEFQAHNDEMHELVEKKEFAKGTHTRYVTARSHVQEFILYKYKKDDLEFRELNYEFVTDYEFYLKTVRNCSHNTTLKYISNFKKIVLRAVAKEIIPKDPFALFKGKKIKIKKYPLTRVELDLIENKHFTSERLATIRDIFIFQCYTGLAYIDVFQLKNEDIKQGVDGKLWIMSRRQKTKSNTDIPLLPKAIEIMEKYKNHPVCIERGSVLPVRSNQKMNAYLSEVAELSKVYSTLNTHKARRTFASTITLNNGVSLHVVKEMLGHHSIKQTEEYAITEQESINKEMTQLRERLFEGHEQRNNHSQQSINQ
ncbi:site-specific integrase [Chryseobacterium sp. ERMR1:04]|uniref:site-specific integrase n=1 Tax=Chryseobacterium sp. ERMR1:04 TaxID=1705393 RepID=UPI0006C843E3|nr:site-specific integrase [Chryseobacterium sp. ERMR1:04]KPH13305.1 recombinase [Chryseobacterium sp. ERMR1:04]